MQKEYEAYVGHPNIKVITGIMASSPDAAANKFLTEHTRNNGIIKTFIIGSVYAPPFFKYNVVGGKAKRVEKIDWDITAGMALR